MSSPSLRGLWNECRATVRGLERWRCCMAFFSSAFLAFGLYHVHSVSGITEGGVLGATLLLDEPTSNLDSLNEAVILRALREERAGRTVVLVSHRASTMRIADMVYSVENGRMS